MNQPFHCREGRDVPGEVRVVVCDAMYSTNASEWICIGFGLPNEQVKPTGQAARTTTDDHLVIGIAGRKPAACPGRLEPLVGRGLLP